MRKILTSLSAAGRRFWITVAIFALVNAGMWIAYHHFYQASRRHLLRVESFLPGDGATVGHRPILSWRFNLDVARETDGPPGQMSPHVPGRWEWRDARTLLFHAEQDLARATRYSVSLLDDRLSTPEGFRLNRPQAWTIQTPALRVLEARQAGFLENGRYLMEVQFSDEVIPANAAKHLELSDGTGRPVKFALNGQAPASFVRVMTDPVPLPIERGRELSLQVRVRAGLTGKSGPLGLAQAFERRIVLGRTLAFTEADAFPSPRGKVEIRLSANGELVLERLRRVLSVDPPVDFTLESSWRGVQLTGAFQPGRRYAVKVGEPPSGANPTEYPRPDTLSVFVPDRLPAAWFEHEVGYLGSAGNRTLMAHAVNIPEVRVSIHRIYENNLVAWRTGVDRYHARDPQSYAQPIATRAIKLDGAKNKVHDLRLELDDLLAGQPVRDGVYRVQLSRPQSERSDEDEDWGGRYRYHNHDEASDRAMVSLSDIGLSAKRSRDELMVWAVSLSTGRALQGVRTRLFSNKNQPLGDAVTAADGLATIRDVRPADGESPAVIVADLRGDPLDPASATASRAMTWLDLREGEWDLADTDVGGRAYLRQGCEAFLYTDRGVYRGGETVRIRAIVRNADHSTPNRFPLKLQVRRPDLRDWRSQTVMLDADGAAALDLALPQDLVTGRWSVHAGLAGGGTTMGQVSFQIEDYMPDRIKAGVTFKGVSDACPRLAGGRPISAQVQADYLFGRPCAGLRTNLTARLDPECFAHKDWGGWTFGDSARLIDLPGTSAVGAVNATLRQKPALGRRELKLDDQGSATWDIGVGGLLGLRSATTEDDGEETDDAAEDEAVAARPPTTAPTTAPSITYRGPWRLSVSASVVETGGRAVTSRNSASVDLLAWYVGVRSAAAGQIRPGENHRIEVALVQPDGRPMDASTELQVSLLRETWNNTMVYRDGRYRYESHRLLEPASGAPPRVTVRNGRAGIDIRFPSSGAYVLRLHDPITGAMSSLPVFASDGTQWNDNISRENPERLQLLVLPMDRPTTSPSTAPAVADLAAGKTEASPFRIGEQAQVVVRSPFAGTLLLTVETDRVVWSRVVEMTASSVAVPIEVSEACRPNAYVAASVVRAIKPDLKWRTHRAFGATRLNVDPADRRLDMTIDAPAEVRPQTTLDVTIQVMDADGNRARSAPVTLLAVDEGILQLTSFGTPSPLGFFSGRRALGVESADLYGSLMPEVPKPDRTSAVGGDKMHGERRHRSPISARRITPVALVTQVLRTDDDGVARAHLSLPQFAGKLRLMAVAHHGHRFGSADRHVLVRSPVLVQSSFPRFAAPGDRFTVPLVVFNNAPSAGEATVRVRLLPQRDGAGAGECPLTVAGAESDQIELKAALQPGGQAQLSADITARQRVGVARVVVSAHLNGESFEETFEMPIRPAAPTITRGGFASLDVGRPHKLSIPDDMLDGTRSLDIKVTPWPTLELPQAMDYLDRYPYGCAEQTISTCFPLAFLSDIGQQIAPGVFARHRIQEKLQVGMWRLLALQAADGGLASWPGASDSWPWASVYGAHFIIEAEAAGFAVPDDLRKGLLGYVRHLLERRIDDGDMLETQAYACYVLASAGRPERAAMSRLGELARAAGAAALPQNAAHRNSARYLLSMAWLASGRRDTAAGLIPQSLPAPREQRELTGNVGSPVRDRALLINTLLLVQPDHPMLPQLVQQLADAARAGQWRSTQDCAFSIMAIGRYLRQYAKSDPYEAADLSMGETRLAASEVGPILAYRGEPRSAGAATRPATCPSAGDFTLRIAGKPGGKGHLTWLQTGVPISPPPDADNGLKLRRQYLDAAGQELRGLVRSGDLVRIVLSLEGPPSAGNVVIEDLLPAGLEIENPRLATTASAEGESNGGSVARFAAARLDVRDDRLVLFGNLPSSGSARYEYLARAVSRGAFVVPPTRAECMYDIGTSSISGGGGKLRVVADIAEASSR